MSNEGEPAVRPAAVLSAAIAAAFMAIVATSSLNVALPSIAASLGVSLSAVHWVVTAYMVSITVGSPLAGWVADARGPRTVIVAGLVAFLIGSCVGALAPSFGVLVASRVVQGVAASTIMPVSMIMVSEAFPPERRGWALGVWAIGSLIGPVVGPTLGGVLVERLGWRWVLGVNVPTAAIVIALALWLVPRRRPSDVRAAQVRFDGVGYGLLTCGVAASVTALALLRTGTADAGFVVCATVGAVALTAYVWHGRRTPNPLYPRELTRDPAVRAALVLTLVRSIALFGPAFLLPMMLQEVLGLDAEHTGLLVAASALSISVASPVAGRLIDRYGARRPAFCATVLIVWSLWAHHDLGPGAGWWPIVWPQVIRGFGVAVLMNASNVTVINRAETRFAGRGASMLSLSNQVFGASAIAGLNVVVALGLGPLVGVSLLGSFEAASAFDRAFVFSAALCIPGLIAAWWLPTVAAARRT